MRRVEGDPSPDIDTRCRSGTENAAGTRSGSNVVLGRTNQEGSVTASSTNKIGMLSRTG